MRVRDSLALRVADTEFALSRHRAMEDRGPEPSVEVPRVAVCAKSIH